MADGGLQPAVCFDTDLLLFCRTQAAIANAQTLAEVERLETALKTGNVPSEVMVRSMCSLL